MHTMYARREGARHFTLRQTRYRPFLEFGQPHPDDVCAVACSLEQLRAMCAGLWPDADYRQATEEDAAAVAAARASLGQRERDRRTLNGDPPLTLAQYWEQRA